MSNCTARLGLQDMYNCSAAHDHEQTVQKSEHSLENVTDECEQFFVQALQI